MDGQLALSDKRSDKHHERRDEKGWSHAVLSTAAAIASRVPLSLIEPIGAAVGLIGRSAFPRRRRICDINLGFCFPNLDQRTRLLLRDRVFRSLGIALFESARAWRRDPEDLRRRVTVEGLEHLRNAQMNGGVLLLGAHFSTLDLAGTLLTLVCDLDVVQRPNENPNLGALVEAWRARHFGAVIDRGNTRRMVRRLRSGRVLWLAADQDLGQRRTLIAPFFGVPAATIAAPLRLALLGRAETLFVSHFREANQRWRICIRPLPRPPALSEHSPTRRSTEHLNLVSQWTARLNATIEEEIRRYPDQYLWIHRRFKSTKHDARYG